MAWALTPASELSVRQLLDESDDQVRAARQHLETVELEVRRMRADLADRIRVNDRLRELLRRPPA